MQDKYIQDIYLEYMQNKKIKEFAGVINIFNPFKPTHDS